VPSSLFYHDSLIPEAILKPTLDSFSGWRGRRWPVIFSCNGGNDDVEQDGGGWYNKREVSKAMTYAAEIISLGIDQKDICLISPFQAQVNLLRRTFRRVGFRAVNIGPLEAFQGLESKVVIVCTTRARERFLQEDRERGLGIVFEKRRFNVAITRAKIGLIVIGNPHLLALDPTWKAFLEFCSRNGLWEPEEEAPARHQSDGRVLEVNDWNHASSKADGELPGHISKLEAALVFAEKGKEVDANGSRSGRFMTGLMDDEQAMWSAGLAAEKALRDEDGDSVM
jgi:helicase MOV-10